MHKAFFGSSNQVEEFHLSPTNRVTPTGEMNVGLPLSDLISYDVSLQWYEAVAVVQQLADTLVARAPGESRHAPEPADIFLNEAGDVVVRGSGSDNEPEVRDVGLILSALIATTNAPPELRLFVSQTTFEVPAYSTIEEFSRSLAYFERPARQDTLRALYARAVEAVAIGVPRPTTQQPLPDEERRRRAEGKSTRRPRTVRRAALLAGVATLLAMVAAGAYWLRGDRMASVRTDVSTLTSSARQTIAGAVKATLTASRDFIAQTGWISAPSPALPPPETPPAPQSKSSRPPAKGSAPRTAGATPPTVSAGSATPVPSTSSDPPPVAEIDPNVYSNIDEAVAAPVIVYPRLPTEASPSLDPSAVGTVELIVDEQGNVESVKLVSSQRFEDSMILSAVKAWRFKPALKDGKPVKYRLRVRLTR